MNDQKRLWEQLAKRNAKYYIYSDKGKSVDEDKFRESGQFDYQLWIENDILIKGEIALDYGCGIGRITEFMVKKFKKVVGVDISGEMIRQAKERLGKIKKIEFLEIDGETIPLPDDSVDFVFSYLVHQHQKTRKMVKASFDEICRVLKPDGLFKVLLRSDEQKNLKKWWQGVSYNLKEVEELCEKFNVRQIRHIDKNAFWLWLTK